MEKKLSNELELSAEFTPNKRLKVALGYDGRAIDAGLYIEIDPTLFAEFLKSQTGDMGDLVIDQIVGFLTR